MSFKLASLKGFRRNVPVIQWPMASHRPQRTNQVTFPIADPAPTCDVLTTVLPKGHSANTAIRSAALDGNQNETARKPNRVRRNGPALGS